SRLPSRYDALPVDRPPTCMYPISLRDALPILESEAALALSMRMARAMDHQDDEHEQLILRIGTAIGKYWICKRTPAHAYEAMERSEEHTSELQSRENLVCRLLLEKKKQPRTGL